MSPLSSSHSPLHAASGNNRPALSPPPPRWGEAVPPELYCGPCAVHPQDWQSLSMTSVFGLHQAWKAPHHARVLQSLLQSNTSRNTAASTEVSRAWLDETDAAVLYVDHSVNTRVEDLVERLRQGGYPATWQATQETTDLDELQDLSGEGDNRHPSLLEGSATDEATAVQPIRTTLHVQGLCCSTEVPSIRKILKKFPGIAKLAIQPTTGRVTIQHVPRVVSARTLAQALTAAGFPATILSTAGDPSSSSTTTHGTVGRSTLHATAVLHAGDIPKIQHAAAAVPGVRRIGVQLAEGAIFLQHDWAVAPVDVVQAGLVKRGYPTTVVQDAQVEAATATTAALVRQPRSKYVESTLHISNLTAGHTALLAKAVRQHFIRAQVRAIHPHVSSRTVKVEHNPQLLELEGLVATLRPYGLDVSVVTDGAAEQLILPLVDEEEEDRQAALRQATHQSSQLSWAVVLAGVFWALSMFSYIGSARDENQGFSDVDETTKGTFYYFEYFGLLAVLLGLPPVAQKAWRTLQRKEFDSNCMMVTAAVGALLLGEWDEAASVAFLFALSEYLERRATERARRALTQIANLRADYCHWIHPETEQIWVVPAEQVPVGALLSVRTGDKIAADGVVVKGSSQVDESSLTGESVPVRKTANDVVQGGSINIGSTPLVVRTTTSVADSTVSRLIRLVEDAQTNTSETEKLIDAFARTYTPTVVGMAAFMCTVPWLWGVDTGEEWTLRGLILIVIACPCALTISTPVTYAAGLAAMAQRGIIIKGGACLEALGLVRTVLFDKTGTLTDGKFQIRHLEEIGETRSREEMLQLLAVMEAPSSHPLSATLVKAAAKEGVQVPTHWSVEDHTILKGEGVTALVEGKQVYVGNQRLFDRLGMYFDLPTAYKGLAEDWQRKGASVGFVGVEREGLVGIYCVTDAVRPGAADVVATLQMNGIRVEMLTGDGEGPALSVAQQVGLHPSVVHSKLLPEDKLHLVGRYRAPASKRMLNRHPTVLFCGDGVNDGPALAVADVGVAMGEGASSLATEVCDVSLMDSNLGKLVDALIMGHRVVSTIQQNIGLSLLGKVVVVSLTFAGRMSLFMAIASDVGVMLVVTLNGMRLLPAYRDLSKKERSLDQQKYDELPLAGSSSPTGVADSDDEGAIQIV